MIKQTITQTIHKFRISSQLLRIVRSFCLKYKVKIILGAFAFTALMLGLIMAWPRTIVFSYGQPSCISQPLIAPSLHYAVDTELFDIIPSGGWSIGDVALMATKICAIPKKVPVAGEHRFAFSPLGVPWLGKTLTVSVPKPPVASAQPFKRPLPVSKPLVVPLTDADRTFHYSLNVGGKTAACPVRDRLLVCDVPRLSLAQGTAYQLELIRRFADQNPQQVARYEIHTLTAVSVSSTSIKSGETVFAKPRAIQLEFDKPVTTVEATLQRVDGDKREKIPIHHTVDNKKLELVWDKDLPRRTSYEVHLDKVQAVDGSTLVEPLTVSFATSGGPKVTGISIGRSKVPLGATAVLTFDQPLLEGQDISKAISGTDGARVTGKQGNQAFVSLASVARCSGFTIAVTDALLSNYEISGGSAWSYSARMQCYTVGSIGTSAKGRPITAYYFGNGPAAAIYTGAIHGNESSTRSLMLRWIDELEANPGGIPAGKSVVVVPVINPDGVALGQRTNANNVDLNRNFGTSDWKKDITTVNNTPFPGGGGSAPMSEPESKAIAGLVAQRRPQLVLSYHSIGGVVISNQAGNASARAATYVSLSGYGNATGESSTTFDYSISGTADDYYAEKLGVPSLVIELGSHTYHQFERNQRAMWAMLK